MQYVLLIYEDERVYGGPQKSGPALQEMMAKHMAFTPTLGSARKGGAGLKGTSSATTVRAGNGKRTVHDGPFAETKEQLGGYYLVEVPDLDAQSRSRRSCRFRRAVRSRSGRSSGTSERRSVKRRGGGA